MKSFMSLLTVGFILSACATSDLPMKANLRNSTGSKDIEVSAEKVSDYSDSYNVLLQINLKNRGGNWVRIDSAELDLSASSEPYNIVVGNDLVVWAEAKAEEKRMERYNEGVGVAGTMLAGGALALAGILSRDTTLTALGGATYAGAATWATVNSISHAQKSAQGVQRVPETHLYAPFSVPSMTLIKRWILINAPSGRISKIAKIKLKTVEGDLIEYDLDLAGKKHL